MPHPCKATIVLVGHSGVGKSTLGLKLADFLGLPFFDIDQEIADLPHVTAYNVNLRRTIIENLTSIKGTVIAAGCEDFSDEIMTKNVKKLVYSVWLSGNSLGRPTRTRVVYTDFYALTKLEQNRIFSTANLKVELGSLDIPASSEVLIAAVRAHLPGLTKL